MPTFTYRSDCGCTLSGRLNAAGELVNCGGILRCPLHAAAPVLFDALVRYAKADGALDKDFECECDSVTPCYQCEARAALALARTPTKGR